MQFTCALLWVCLAAAVFEATNAQSIHVVKVGDTGSFYDPQVTTANTGDTVSFQWTGMFHSVTQSSFDNPCTPLAGGFDSGITGNPPETLILPEWNLTITDDTQPIFFFCTVTVPVSHCTSGMVGAINVPLSGVNHSFTNFSQNAKAIRNPPILSATSPSLTGVGAVAVSTPIPVNNVSSVTSNSSTSTSTSTSSTSSAPANTTTPAAAPPQQNASHSSGLSPDVKGAIAGGVVGGVLLLILLALLYMSYDKGRRYREQAQAHKILRSKSSHDMSQLERPDLLDISRSDPLPTVVPRAARMHQRSQGSLSLSDSAGRDSGGVVTIKELAAEIAKNIRQEMGTQDSEMGMQDRTLQDGLTPVPEQAIVNAVMRSESARGGNTVRRVDSGRATEPSLRGAESTRSGRQLPIPPQKRSDVQSVDTLPVYVPGHPR